MCSYVIDNVKEALTWLTHSSDPTLIAKFAYFLPPRRSYGGGKIGPFPSIYTPESASRSDFFA